MSGMPTGLSQRWPHPFLPRHLFACLAAIGGLAGVLMGAVLGSSYLPTLPFALVEGGILVGVPAALVGGVLAGIWSLTRRVLANHR